jgi:glycosyltransferase involved in cell wall biosynthesis
LEYSQQLAMGDHTLCSSARPLVSVVIPAYNGAETLPACLSALQSQTLPPDQYEIIVVDDGSTDGTAEVARRFGVRVLSQLNAGPAAARNRGAIEARGELLCFTDADCAPAADWLACMATALVTPGVVGVKGVYRTRQKELVARFVQAEYEDRYERMQKLERIDFIDTYSAGYRRDVFLAAGGFDVSFPTASVEDQELSFRLAEAGHLLRFVPEAAVYHIHDRTTCEYIRRKFWIGYWKVRVMLEHPGKLLRDSHTPQMLKLQIVLAAVGALLLLAGPLNRWLGLTGLAAWAILVLSSLPFLVKLLRRDPPVALLAPFFIFVRAWALGLGLLTGTLAILIRRIKSQSAAKDGHSASGHRA